MGDNINDMGHSPDISFSVTLSLELGDYHELINYERDVPSALNAA